MEFRDAPILSSDVLTLETRNTSGFTKGESIQIEPYQDSWIVVQGSERVLVNCSSSDREYFSRLVHRDQVRWLLTDVKKTRLYVQHCSPVEVSELNLEIGVDELIVDDLYSKREMPDKDMDGACRWLSDHFVIDEGSTQWLSVRRFSNATDGGGFQLLGNGWRADIERQDSGALLVRRLTRHVTKDAEFSLLVGSFTFVDQSVASVLISGSQRAILDAALRNNASYLELWKLYNDKEWEASLKQAEELSTLRFSACEAFEDGRENAWRLTPRNISDLSEFRGRWKGLELSKNNQVDLSVDPPDWSEELSGDEGKESNKNTPRGNIVFESSHIIFKPASNRKNVRPTMEEGWLSLSLAGSRIAGQRRLSAKQAIDTGRRFPQLKWLLEGASVPSRRQRTHDGLTRYAEESFKGGKPTDKQKDALYAAINTPDIAIIIGPPGTGKTQVIAALQRRIAELQQTQRIAGQMLISSYQHDAVDNALDRSDVYGLPASRVGGKHDADAEDRFIVPWIDQKVNYLEEKINLEYQKYPELEEIRKLAERLLFIRISGYRTNKLIAEFEQVLCDLKEMEQFGLYLPPELESDLEEYIAELKSKQLLSSETGKTDKELLRRIRALRTTEAGFSDDGADRAWDLMSWLKREHSSTEKEFLEFLETISEKETLDEKSGEQLADLKDRLLDRALPDYRPLELRGGLDDETIDLLNRIDHHIEGRISHRKQGVASVLEQLNESLKFDRKSARSIVSEYTMVVGATCQQAAGQHMANLKEVAGLNASGIEFETVIIDEAARANPLDLFVPMAMANRRIILVGDDRQLPHMLEPDLENQLQEEHKLTELQLEAFRTSLFERLRVKLLDAQKQDSKPRVVMLDTQFRMHPILGDFISKQFYEDKEQKEKKERVIKSGREAGDFSFDNEILERMGSLQNYYRDRVCQWIDVPLDEGKASKSGTSRIRVAEADRVVEEVKTLLEAGGDDLSVGVITFYAAQRELIMQKLSDVRINDVPVTSKREGEYVIHDDFRWIHKEKPDGTISMEERIRVGSVDAFQGKEFDVVILSCVRTLNTQASGIVPEMSEENREKYLNRQFGFLRLPNRMNVAMSRQRKMLLCVGDASLVTNSLADEAIPSLAAFYKLCGGENGCIR